MKSQTKKEYLILGEQFESGLFEHILKWYTKDIRENYNVTGLTKIDDDKWAIRLEYNKFKQTLK